MIYFPRYYLKKHKYSKWIWSIITILSITRDTYFNTWTVFIQVERRKIELHIWHEFTRGEDYTRGFIQIFSVLRHGSSRVEPIGVMRSRKKDISHRRINKTVHMADMNSCAISAVNLAVKVVYVLHEYVQSASSNVCLAQSASGQLHTNQSIFSPFEDENSFPDNPPFAFSNIKQMLILLHFFFCTNEGIKTMILWIVMDTNNNGILIANHCTSRIRPTQWLDSNWMVYFRFTVVSSIRRVYGRMHGLIKVHIAVTYIVDNLRIEVTIYSD